jgi:hypothetical protein
MRLQRRSLVHYKKDKYRNQRKWNFPNFERVVLSEDLTIFTTNGRKYTCKKGDRVGLDFDALWKAINNGLPADRITQIYLGDKIINKNSIK